MNAERVRLTVGVVKKLVLKINRERSAVKMKDETKAKMNNVKTKAEKPTKLQQLRAEAVEKAREKARDKEEERVKANETFKADVEKELKETGRLDKSDSNSEWENDDGIDPKSKEARLQKTLERRKQRQAKKMMRGED